MAKAHVVTWKSIVTEEWLVEGAANAAEAREMFANGECRIVSRSEFDVGCIRGVRLATESDFAGAALQQAGGTDGRPE